MKVPVMDSILMKIVHEAFGIEALHLERMTVGRINSVYNVTLPDREVIVRCNENPFVLKGTSRNISILGELQLPVPQVIMEDLTKERYPFHYMILEKIPGRDLKFELAGMTNTQMTKLAETIVSFQQKVAQLPLGTGYGWVPINDQGEFKKWKDIIYRDLHNGLPNIQNEVSTAEVERTVQELDRLAPYFDNIRPVCFLDDVTTKNVIMLNGELQGIVDLDCVCYGDPLYMISLTQTAIIADIHESDLFYIEELCRIWGLTEEQRKIVDYYSLIFAMNFLGYFSDDDSGYRQTAAYVKKWIAQLS
jgi:aminoglycoside phosphotransferase (APT) family kinase protein